MIRFLEELSYNAWPCLQTLHYDGWLLRFAAGFTRRANSINPIYPATLAPIDKIKVCETLYKERHLDTVFKMTDAVWPADLDNVLQAQGYAREAGTSVQVLDFGEAKIKSVGLRSNIKVQMSAQVSDTWLNAYFRLNERDVRHLPTMRSMLNAIAPRTGYIELQSDGERIAVGLGVLEQDYVGLFDIVVAPEWRRQGIGGYMISQLWAWGQQNGAHHAYLQVMQSNEQALKLYASLGFREVYQYWYRVKPLASLS